MTQTNKTAEERAREYRQREGFCGNMTIPIEYAYLAGYRERAAEVERLRTVNCEITLERGALILERDSLKAELEKAHRSTDKAQALVTGYRDAIRKLRKELAEARAAVGALSEALNEISKPSFGAAKSALAHQALASLPESARAFLEKHEKMERALEPTPCYGRTEYIVLPGGYKILVWAMYRGEESQGYLKKTPFAWFSKHADAARLRYGVPEALDGSEASRRRGEGER